MRSLSSLSYRTCLWAAWLVLLWIGTGCESSPADDGNDGLALRWTYAFDDAAGPYLPPHVVGDSLVLFSADARLYAVRTADGSRAWRSAPVEPTASELFSFHLEAEGNTVYGAHTGRLLGWNAASGDLQWAYDPGDDRPYFELGYFDVNDEHVYGSTSQRHLVVLNRHTGRPVFDQPVEQMPRSLVRSSTRLYVTQAWTDASANNAPRGAVAALDPDTGNPVWRTETDGGFYTSPLILDDGVLYAGTNTGDAPGLYAVDAETGSVLWKSDPMPVHHVAADARHLYVNDGSRIHAVRRTSGQTAWTTDLQAGAGLSKVSVLDGYVYHAHNGVLFVLNAETGAIAHAERPGNTSDYWEVGTSPSGVYAQTTYALMAFEPYEGE